MTKGQLNTGPRTTSLQSQIETRDFVHDFSLVNWSYAIAPFPGDMYGGCEMLSDFDSIVLNMAQMDQFYSDRHFIYLESFVIDMMNMTVFENGSMLTKVDYMLMRTPDNFRRRSWLTQKKSIGNDIVLHSK
jgi:hypothetical protein